MISPRARHDRTIERRATDVRLLEDRLNALLQRGHLLEAYGRYYRDAVLVRGTAAGQSAEEWVLRFLRWAEQFVAASPTRSMVSGPASYSVWTIRSETDGGAAVRRMVARHWRAGRVVREHIENVTHTLSQARESERHV